MAVIKKLTSPQGATVGVDESRVDNLLRHGFTQDDSKAPAKKAAAKKSS